MKATLLGACALLVAVLTADSVRDLERDASLPTPAQDADFYDDGAPAPEKVELGRLLFFDKILSGNRNIACATCHHPALGTADGVALGLGEGASALGTERRAGSALDEGVHGRIPRNAPALFNLGAREFVSLFHDGRVEVDTAGHYASGFISPARWKLPEGLDNVLAAQAMFPVGSPGEMAGQKGENPIADAVSLNNMAGPGGVWELLASRLRDVPEYVDRFRVAFPEQVQHPDDIDYVLAANAIAAFESVSFRSDESPFDAYLRGTPSSLDADERRGMALFYGKAGCSDCHSGTFQTDHDFHAIAMPQLGPGKGDGSSTSYWSASGERAFLEDLGRGRVTVRREDDFKFRTPTLRNVALTGPWGHDGAYDTLEGVVRHHLDPVGSLERYRADASSLPPLDGVLETTMQGSELNQRWLSPRRLRDFARRDTWVHDRAELRERIAAANELAPTELTDDEVDDLIRFLETLTDPSASDLSIVVPERVPSGLPVER